MDWEHMELKKRRLLLVVSVVVMLMSLYYGMRDFYDVSYRLSHKSEEKEERRVPDFLPPDTVIIPAGHRDGSIQRENHELVGGGIMKWVLGVGFFVWCLLKYLEEKRLTEATERQQRKNREIEINLMLDKEKRLAKYWGEDKGNDTEDENG